MVDDEVMWQSWAEKFTRQSNTTKYIVKDGNSSKHISKITQKVIKNGKYENCDMAKYIALCKSNKTKKKGQVCKLSPVAKHSWNHST